MEKENQALIAIVSEALEKKYWKEIIIIFDVSQGSVGFSIKYLDEELNTHKLKIKGKELGFYLQQLHLLFLDKNKDESTRFNKLRISIKSDKKYLEKYYWDDDKEKQDKLMSAKYFPFFVVDRIRLLISEFEKNKGVLPFIMDDNNEKEYLSSWDNGIFIFIVKGNTLEYEIYAVKDEVKRFIDMTLPEHLIEAFISHHKMTNFDLTEEWQPWNKLVINTPHKGISHIDEKDYIQYSLE